MMRRLLTPLAVLAAVMALPAGASAGGGSPDPVAITPSSDAPSRYIVEFQPGAVPVVVKADDPRAPEIARDATAEAIVDDVEADGGDLVHDYDDLPFVAVETDDASTLWDMPGVVNVSPEIRVTRTLDASLDVIEAADSDLSAAIGGTKVDGTGVAVAIIDDGIDRTHPFFMRNGTTRVVAEACFTFYECPNGSDAETGVGAAAHHVFDDGSSDFHGTHVAGIAAGNSNGGSWVGRGVAGNADIVAVQVFGSDGGASSIDIDRALDWLYDRVTVDGANIASVNLSLGSAGTSSVDCNVNTATRFLVDDLASVGVTVIVAAGNASSRTSISWPACLPNVVPVGSTTDGDVVSWFSNIGTQVRDRGVVAPGSGICSSFPLAVNPSGYQCISGTSMAAPHVAGLAALVRQARPSATVAEVKAALRTTPTVITDTRSGGTVAGLRRINAWTAIGAVLSDQGEMRGTLTDVTGGGPAPLSKKSVAVALTSSNQVSGPASVTASVVTDTSGGYRLRVPAGTWSSVFTYSDYDPSTSASSSVTPGGSVQRNATVAIARGTVTGTIDQSSTVHAAATFTLTPTGQNTKPSTITVVDPLPQNGAFSLTGVRIGTWSLQVTSGDYASEPIPVTVVADTTTTLSSSVALNLPTGTIAVTAIDSLGSTPVASAFTVVATPEAPVGTRSVVTFQGTSSAQGLLTLPNMRVGSWSLSISSPDYQPRVIAGVSVSLGSATSVSATLTPLPGGVVGAVSDPLATSQANPSTIVVDQTVDLTLAPTAPLNGRTTITASRSLATTGGSFALTGVPPGSWSLTGSVFGYQPLPATPVTVLPNGTADVGLFSLTRRTAVASALPATGSTAGGTLVTIRGRHLTGATAVSFGNVAADPASITVVDDTQITVLTPASSAGTVNVTVIAALGASTDSVPFAFAAPPPSGGGGGGGGGGGAPSPRTSPIAPSVGGVARTTAAFSFGTVVLSLSGVSGSGDVTVSPKAGKPTYDSGGVLIPGYYFEITTTVSDFGSAEICAPIETGNLSSYNLTVNDLRLFHWENDVRRDITTRIDTVNNRVCGVASSFSPFAVGALQTRRLAGADRYATAASISVSEFDAGVAVAYIVTGEKFPDALAAGAAAGRESGPVLLTRFGSLPSQTRAELARLKPRRVIVVGGPSVIAEGVLAEIRTVVGSVPVERVWGADRFTTSAQLSQRTFASASTVYVGSGLGFTEILAASAAAGRDKAPLLLVPGTGPNAGVPLSVGLELARLKPTKVIVVGGAGLVAPVVVNQVKLLVPSASVTQIGGVDAYDTAAKIARTFSSGGTVFVATGDVFADGLAGGAVAASRGYAMVMVPPSGALPSTVRSALSALAPRQIKVLGGPAAVAYDVENSVAKYLPS